MDRDYEVPEAPAPQTPEARRRRLIRAHARFDDTLKRLGPGSRAWTILKRVLAGVWNDGFIHAGNIAYLTLLTVFPFFILLAALAHALGEGAVTMRAVNEFLASVPHSVADVLRKPIADALLARSGTLLWLGALGGIWSTGGFIATIKDILYRAYGVRSTATFWLSRLRYAGLIIGAGVLLLIAFIVQAALTGVGQFIDRIFPWDTTVLALVEALRVVPGLAIFGGFYMLFYTMTPRRYRERGCRKWPGPLLIAIWWLLVTSLLPPILRLVGNYNLTYGSLAGVIIALLFFFMIGLGVVIGAHLNAALAVVPASALRQGEEAAAAKETL